MRLWFWPHRLEAAVTEIVVACEGSIELGMPTSTAPAAFRSTRYVISPSG